MLSLQVPKQLGVIGPLVALMGTRQCNREVTLQEYKRNRTQVQPIMIDSLKITLLWEDVATRLFVAAPL